ncbi:hypothetical protein R3Q06_00785 [Rhodococcus erythropolis]|uniref:hypothetical protein n=1 Tax=Rhodococcus erythropolis TaxID=1833 RepID=UPI002949DF77|nr:hypothetical protein [Rhodococcus erythropolis]MDV6272022.1 hypothetical protein [Rhodococcus erythropolis]
MPPELTRVVSSAAYDGIGLAVYRPMSSSRAEATSAASTMAANSVPSKRERSLPFMMVDPSAPPP